VLTKKSKYALKALLALAREYNRGPVLILELARTEGIPKKFLEIILLDLKHRGLLDSKRGRGGGYVLGRPPEEITVGEVIRMFEGPLALLPCASLTAYRKCDDCADERACGVRLVMKDVRDATARILDATTLADMLRRVRGERASDPAEKEDRAPDSGGPDPFIQGATAGPGAAFEPRAVPVRPQESKANNALPQEEGNTIPGGAS
jgi:Rrf2 family protein